MVFGNVFSHVQHRGGKNSPEIKKTCFNILISFTKSVILTLSDMLAGGIRWKYGSCKPHRWSWFEPKNWMPGKKGLQMILFLSPLCGHSALLAQFNIHPPTHSKQNPLRQGEKNCSSHRPHFYRFQTMISRFSDNGICVRPVLKLFPPSCLAFLRIISYRAQY